MGDSLIRGFVLRAMAHVERAYPEVVFDRAPEEIERMLRGLIDEARSFGLSREDTVGRFIDYRCELGERFYEAPAWAWTAAILRDKERSEREKIDALDELLYGGPRLPPETR